MQGPDRYSFILFLAIFFIAPKAILKGQGCDHLVAYWILEESGGDTYRDVIGGHDAIALSTEPTQVDGRIGKAQAFNGTTDYISIVAHPDFDWGGTQSFTIEMWAILDSISYSDNMVFIGRDADAGTVHWWVGAEKGSGRAMFVLVSSTGTVSTVYGPVMELGSWYHLVAVRDAETNTNKLYINHTLAGSEIVDYSAGHFITDATIDIGVLNYNGSADRFFAPVTLDELAVYDIALSGPDIGSHFNNGLRGIGYCGQEPPFFLTVPDSMAVVYEQFTYTAIARGTTSMTYTLESGPGSIDPVTGTYTWTPESLDQSGILVEISASNENESVTQRFHVYLAELSGCPDSQIGYYRLNEILDTTYRDLTGGLSGEPLDAPVPYEGRFNGAQLFDGQNDGIRVPDGERFNFPANSGFSIEFWVKTAGRPGNMVCVGRQGTTIGQETSDLHMWVGIEGGTDSLVFFLRDSSGNEPVPNGMIKGPEVADNTWHYVVAVRDGEAGVSRLYLDGSMVAESVAYEYPDPFAGLDDNPLDIGYLHRANGNPGYFFSGALDEVAIYNRALTTGEIMGYFDQAMLDEWHCSPGNYAPGFVSEPVTEATMGVEYLYQIVTTDIESGPAGLSLDGMVVPEWLEFSDHGSGTGTLAGIPQATDVGTDTVVISVSDGISTVEQDFIILIGTPDGNVPPVITSEPDTIVVAGENYTYILAAMDPDGDTLVKSAITLPEFLAFDTLTGTLEGIPGEGHVGDHGVLLSVSDGSEEVMQAFTLTVNPNPLGHEDPALQMLHIYPVPADKHLVLEIGLEWTGTALISVLDVRGRLVSADRIRAGQEQFRIDLSGLAQGAYLVTFQTDASVVHKPFFISR